MTIKVEKPKKILTPCKGCNGDSYYRVLLTHSGISFTLCADCMDNFIYSYEENR